MEESVQIYKIEMTRREWLEFLRYMQRATHPKVVFDAKSNMAARAVDESVSQAKRALELIDGLVPPDMVDDVSRALDDTL